MLPVVFEEVLEGDMVQQSLEGFYGSVLEEVVLEKPLSFLERVLKVSEGSGT